MKTIVLCCLLALCACSKSDAPTAVQPAPVKTVLAVWSSGERLDGVQTGINEFTVPMVNARPPDAVIFSIDGQQQIVVGLKHN